MFSSEIFRFCCFVYFRFGHFYSVQISHQKAKSSFMYHDFSFLIPFYRPVKNS